MRRLYRRILGHICIYIYIKYINNNPREKYRRRQEDERSLASCLEWSVHRWGEREWRKTSRITTRFINLSKGKKGKTRYPTYGSCHTIVVRSMHASNILPSSHTRNGEWKHATPCATRISRTCMTFPRLLFCRKLLLCISPSWSFSLFLPFFLSSSHFSLFDAKEQRKYHEKYGWWLNVLSQIILRVPGKQVFRSLFLFPFRDWRLENEKETLYTNGS